MDASKRSPLSSFRSKKPLRSNAREDGSKTPVVSPDEEAKIVSAPSLSPLGVKTPGKVVDPPRRLRNSSAAMSIKEVRQAARMLRERRSAESLERDPEPEPDKARVTKPEEKPAGSEATLPEKYELLDKFFNSLDSSIRLLQLKRSATTFTNISSQVERLTDRRFTHSHLAQLKFIMPEAIVLEKVLRRDESTSCMMPDLRITLNVEANDEQSNSSSRNLRLRKVFRARLLDFFKSHPEGDEVPEEALPEPFGQLKKDLNLNLVQSSVQSLMGESEMQDGAMVGQTVMPSHLSLSFTKRFSQQGSNLKESEKKHRSSVSVQAFGSEQEPAESPSGKETRAIAAKSHSEFSLKPSFDEYCSSNKDSSSSIPESPLPKNPDHVSDEMLMTPIDHASYCSSYSPLPETPVKCITSASGKDQSSLETAPALKTPVDHASTPAKLMSATPGLQPPKRCYMSPDDNSTRFPNKLARRPPPKRPLTFGSPVKSVKKVDESGSSSMLSIDDDIYDILPENLLQSIQEKERLAKMEEDPAISQAKWRKKMIACLPRLFNMVYFLFQNIRRTVVTKEELIQKIISGHLEINDRSDVEEQLRLLQELAPDWISEKVALSGDRLICVNKFSCPESIRARLSQAK